MKLTVLGCGDAFGNGGRSNTSFLISKDEKERILIDCGASTLIRLKHESIDLESISTIIITHFHGDHFGGIPFLLISSLFENKRNSPLTIVGPKGVERRVLELLEAMYKGTAEKLGYLDLHFIEYHEGSSLKTKDFTLTAFQVDHSPPSLPHAIRIEWADKVFAFSGDTSWTDALISLSNNADLFICECNSLSESGFGHISYQELLSKRDQLTCKQMWISHMNSQVINDEKVLFNKLYDGMNLEF